MLIGVDPIATVPIADFDIVLVDIGGLVTFYLSDRQFTTSPIDVPSNQSYDPRIAEPLVIERSAPLTPDTSSRVVIAFGEIVLINTDGFFDEMVNRYAVDGRRVTVRAGSPGFDFSEFVILFDGTAAGWRVADDNTVRITLRENTWRVEVPAQVAVYAGTGGLNGGEDLAGKPKPLTYGDARNVPAALVDGALLIYQVHDGAVQAISTVYDRGVDLGMEGDTTALTTTTPEPGFVLTDVARGLFRLGSRPAGVVTADVLGDAASGVYVSRTADIVQRLLTAKANLTSSEIASDTFAHLNNLQPAPVGFFVGTAERPTVGALADMLLAGIVGYWGADRVGRIEVGRIDGPGSFPKAFFTVIEIIDLQRLEVPEGISPPAWRRTVAWGRNWSPQQDEFSPLASQERVGWLQHEFRVSERADSTILVKHLLAPDPAPVPGLFAAETDAGTEAERLLELWGPDRQLFRMRIKTQGYLLDIGDTVHVTYPRHGLKDGMLCQIVGIALDTIRNETSLTILGGFPEVIWSPPEPEPPEVTPTSFLWVGTGGAEAGGAATVILAATYDIFVYAPTGGAVASGAADSTLTPIPTIQVFTYAASGGAATAGAAETSYALLQVTIRSYSGSGGAVASGAAATSFTGWTPASLTNLQGWFHPASGVTVAAGRVSQWTDASGENNHATQLVAGNQPDYVTGLMNGKPGLRFTRAVPHFLLANGVATTPLNLQPDGNNQDKAFSIAFVARFTAALVAGQFHTVLGCAQTIGNVNFTAFSRLDNGAFRLEKRDNGGGWVRIDTTATDDQQWHYWRIVCTAHPTPVLTIWRDAVKVIDAVACDAATFQLAQTFSIGALNRLSPANYADLEFMEGIVCAADAWNAATADLVGTYLANAYSLPLPSGARVFATLGSGGAAAGGAGATEYLASPVTPFFVADFRTETVDSKVVVSRSGNTATRIGPAGLLAAVNANLPRIDYDPLTTAARGLLVEEARTNYCEFAEALGSHNTINCSVTANETTAPNAAATADKMIPNTTPAVQHRTQNLTRTASGTDYYSMSCFAKPAGYNWMVLRFYDSAWSEYNIATGALGAASAVLNIVVESFLDSWRRIGHTVLPTAASHIARWNVLIAAGSWDFAGSGVDGARYWGTQIELGRFRTSYIPTVDATAVTRNADDATTTISALTGYVQSKGSRVVRGRTGPITTEQQQTIYREDDGSSANYIALIRNTSQELHWLVVSSSVTVADLNLGTVAANTYFQAALGWDTNTFRACLNGGTMVVDSGGTPPAGLTAIRYGAAP